MIIWKIINRLAKSARKAPAGWFGTELPLERIRSVVEKDNRTKNHLLNVFAIDHSRVTGIFTERIHRFNVGDHVHNSVREH